MNKIYAKWVWRGGVVIATWGISMIIWQLFTHPNLFQIDFGGHIASAQFFINNGLHGWTQNWFQGLVNNLFYPPLEDFLVACIHWITGMSVLYAYITYTALLVFAYFLVFLLIAKRLEWWGSRVIYFLGVILFLCLNKFPNIVFFQGMGIVDMLFTGLVSQILGGVFFLLVIYELLGNKNIIRMTLYTILALLSHLVVGPVTLLVLCTYFVVAKYRFWYKSLGSIILLTAFFWVPFVLYRGLMASSNIIHSIPNIIILLLVGCLFFAKRGSVIMLLALAGLAIIIPTELLFFAQNIGLHRITLPSFHYYRFAIIATLLMIIAVVALIDYLWEQKKLHKEIFDYGIWGVVFLLVISINVATQGMWSAVKSQIGSTHIPTVAEFSKLQNLDPTKKIFTIDGFRPVDFAIDSIVQHMDAPHQYVKGLFWESSFTNHLLSSYLATLISRDNVVLSAYTLGTLPQDNYNKIREYFIRDYSIGYILVVDPQYLQYPSQEIRNNLSHMLEIGTKNIIFVPQEKITINDRGYTLYTIKEEIPAILQNNIVSVVRQNPKQIIIDRHDEYFANTILGTYLNTSGGIEDHTFTITMKGDLVLPDMQPSSGSVLYTYTTNSTANITLSGMTDAWVKVSMAPLPGILFTNPDGSPLKQYETPYARYIYVHQGAVMQYVRPLGMKFGYVISLLALIGYISYFGYLLRKRKSQYKYS